MFYPVHQDSLSLLTLTLFRIQENMQTPTRECPPKRDILVMEEILEHKFITNNLNIVKCNVCLECHMQSTIISPSDKDIYTCKKCLKRKDLNIVKCNVCLECHMQSTIISPSDKDIYTCKKCLKRKDNDYYLRNNLHPVWFEVNEDGSYKLDEAGKKIPHFEIPHELKRLTVAERLLIRRCATFVPSVHLSNTCSPRSKSLSLNTE